MSQLQNYKPLVLEKIEEFSRSVPEYSFCELLFSFISQYEKTTGKKFDKEDLLGGSTSDQLIYKCITSAIEKELKYSDKPVKVLSKPKYNLQDNVDILYTADLAYWNTTLSLIENVQKSFDKESKARLEYIIIKQTNG